MHLIAPLVSGIRGAENGYVRLYQRGTSTAATWYSSFEGDDADSSGDDIALDENGGATVFVNGLVRVEVLTSAGVTLRTFTDGVSAESVEYQGLAFSGVNYDDASSGAGSGYPTTLQAILDRALTSFGGIDWYALLGGSSVTVQSALGALAGLIFNVKNPAYGAVGDGVTNDGSAIDAALTAATAAGGVVYFPPGTYLRTTKMTLPAKVSLLGAGPNASAISINHASNTLLETAGSTTYESQFVYGLRLTAAQACTGNAISVLGGSKVVFQNCYVGGANCDGALVAVATSATTTYKVIDCVFELGALNVAAVSHAGSAKRATYRGCRFVVPAGNYSPTPAAVVSANNIDLIDCTFDGSLATAGTFSYFLASSTTLAASLRDCNFVSTGGGTATAITLGTYTATSVFHESGSVFGSSGVTAYSYTTAAASVGAVVKLVTRETRVQHVTNPADLSTLATDQYGVIIINATTAANRTWNGDLAAPDGAQGTIYIYNGTGAPRDLFLDSESTTVTGFRVEPSQTSLDMAYIRKHTYTSVIVPAVAVCLVSDWLDNGIP